MEQKRIDMVEYYVDELDAVDGGTGIARETSYYHVLGKLVKSLGGDDVRVIIGPVPRKDIHPDFAVGSKNGGTIGYIEAKKLGSDLDNAATQKQVMKYLDDVPNVILTNYMEFRLYRGTGNYSVVYIDCDEDAGEFPSLLYEELVSMIDRFIAKSASVETDICRIAEYLADITRDELKPAIIRMLDKDLDNWFNDRSVVGELLELKNSFDRNLTGSVDHGQFASMYAQIITYGLLEAKISHTDAGRNFDRYNAIGDINRSSDMLRSLYKFISTSELPAEIDTAIESIVGILNETNPAAVMERYYSEGRGKKWFEHFYETFLSIYDPEERKRRGVYYTPDQVVSYINRSVNCVLKNSFGKELGFADESVAVLDPAVGTMTFLADACQIAIDEKIAADGDGMIDDFIHDHILEHFYGYEVMVTPYVLSHLRTKALLDKNGYSGEMDKNGICLANTLDLERCSRAGGEQTTFDSDVDRAISKERKRACMIHLDTEIIAVIGNPPYKGDSANKGMFDDETKLYKDAVKGERKIGILSDDYVKFIRFAHKRIDDQGEGVIGFITNNSYLNGKMARGMREELMKSFDEIYILDLHGNTRSPIPGDEGVFNITVGTAIVIFVKTSDNPECNVYYSDFVGSKKSKFERLDAGDIITTDWQELYPHEPHYFFIPNDSSGEEDYDEFMSLEDVFNERSSGVQTSRDVMTIQKTKEDIWDVVNDFAGMDIEDARIKYSLGDDGKAWNAYLAQNDVIDSGLDIELVNSILYRPFDVMYTYYTGNTRGFMFRPRRGIMQHMMHDNLAMLVTKQQSKTGFYHAFVSDVMAESAAVSNRTREGNYVCPLYLYSDRCVKRPNIKSYVVGMLSTAYGVDPTPEDIFYYIYGILYSNAYREKYAEFLKIDFPKIPFTDDYELFVKIGDVGKKLADLHLMKSEVFKTGSVKYCGHGDNVVGTVKHDGIKRVTINKVKYFDGVSSDVWEYQIGGYKPAQKWLKDRKGDALTLDNTDHYRCICNALEATIELQTELDGLYGDVENSDVLNFDTRKDSEISEY